MKEPDLLLRHASIVGHRVEPIGRVEPISVHVAQQECQWDDVQSRNHNGPNSTLKAAKQEGRTECERDVRVEKGIGVDSRAALWSPL